MSGSATASGSSLGGGLNGQEWSSLGSTLGPHSGSVSSTGNNVNAGFNLAEGNLGGLLSGLFDSGGRGAGGGEAGAGGGGGRGGSADFLDSLSGLVNTVRAQPAQRLGNGVSRAADAVLAVVGARTRTEMGKDADMRMRSVEQHGARSRCGPDAFAAKAVTDMLAEEAPFGFPALAESAGAGEALNRLVREARTSPETGLTTVVFGTGPDNAAIGAVPPEAPNGYNMSWAAVYRSGSPGPRVGVVDGQFMSHPVNGLVVGVASGPPPTDVTPEERDAFYNHLRSRARVLFQEYEIPQEDLLPLTRKRSLINAAYCLSGVRPGTARPLYELEELASRATLDDWKAAAGALVVANYPRHAATILAIQAALVAMTLWAPPHLQQMALCVASAGGDTSRLTTFAALDTETLEPLMKQAVDYLGKVTDLGIPRRPRLEGVAALVKASALPSDGPQTQANARYLASNDRVKMDAATLLATLEKAMSMWVSAGLEGTRDEVTERTRMLGLSLGACRTDARGALSSLALSRGDEEAMKAILPVVLCAAVGEGDGSEGVEDALDAVAGLGTSEIEIMNDTAGKARARYSTALTAVEQQVQVVKKEQLDGGGAKLDSPPTKEEEKLAETEKELAAAERACAGLGLHRMGAQYVPARSTGGLVFSLTSRTIMHGLRVDHSAPVVFVPLLEEGMCPVETTHGRGLVVAQTATFLASVITRSGVLSGGGGGGANACVCAALATFYVLGGGLMDVYRAGGSMAIALTKGRRAPLVAMGTGNVAEQRMLRPTYTSVLLGTSGKLPESITRLVSAFNTAAIQGAVASRSSCSLMGRARITTGTVDLRFLSVAHVYDPVLRRTKGQTPKPPALYQFGPGASAGPGRGGEVDILESYVPIQGSPDAGLAYLTMGFLFGRASDKREIFKQASASSRARMLLGMYGAGEEGRAILEVVDSSGSLPEGTPAVLAKLIAAAPMEKLQSFLDTLSVQLAPVLGGGGRTRRAVDAHRLATYAVLHRVIGAAIEERVACCTEGQPGPQDAGALSSALSLGSIRMDNIVPWTLNPGLWKTLMTSAARLDSLVARRPVILGDLLESAGGAGAANRPKVGSKKSTAQAGGPGGGRTGDRGRRRFDRQSQPQASEGPAAPAESTEVVEARQRLTNGLQRPEDYALVTRSEESLAIVAFDAAHTGGGTGSGGSSWRRSRGRSRYGGDSAGAGGSGRSSGGGQDSARLQALFSTAELAKGLTASSLVGQYREVAQRCLAVGVQDLEVLYAAARLWIGGFNFATHAEQLRLNWYEAERAARPPLSAAPARVEEPEARSAAAPPGQAVALTVAAVPVAQPAAPTAHLVGRELAAVFERYKSANPGLVGRIKAAHACHNAALVGANYVATIRRYTAGNSTDKAAAADAVLLFSEMRADPPSVGLMRNLLSALGLAGISLASGASTGRRMMCMRVSRGPAPARRDVRPWYTLLSEIMPRVSEHLTPGPEDPVDETLIDGSIWINQSRCEALADECALAAAAIRRYERAAAAIESPMANPEFQSLVGPLLALCQSVGIQLWYEHCAGDTSQEPPRRTRRLAQVLYSALEVCRLDLESTGNWRTTPTTHSSLNLARYTFGMAMVAAAPPLEEEEEEEEDPPLPSPADLEPPKMERQLAIRRCVLPVRPSGAAERSGRGGSAGQAGGGRSAGHGGGGGHQPGGAGAGLTSEARVWVPGVGLQTPDPQPPTFGICSLNGLSRASMAAVARYPVPGLPAGGTTAEREAQWVTAIMDRCDRAALAWRDGRGFSCQVRAAPEEGDPGAWVACAEDSGATVISIRPELAAYLGFVETGQTGVVGATEGEVQMPVGYCRRPILDCRGDPHRITACVVSEASRHFNADMLVPGFLWSTLKADGQNIIDRLTDCGRISETELQSMWPGASPNPFADSQEFQRSEQGDIVVGPDLQPSEIPLFARDIVNALQTAEGGGIYHALWSAAGTGMSLEHLAHTARYICKGAPDSAHAIVERAVAMGFLSMQRGQDGTVRYFRRGPDPDAMFRNPDEFLLRAGPRGPRELGSEAGVASPRREADRVIAEVARGAEAPRAAGTHVALWPPPSGGSGPGAASPWANAAPAGATRSPFLMPIMMAPRRDGGRRPTMWWRPPPPHVQAAIQADIARVRTQYLARQRRTEARGTLVIVCFMCIVALACFAGRATAAPCGLAVEDLAEKYSNNICNQDANNHNCGWDGGDCAFACTPEAYLPGTDTCVREWPARELEDLDAGAAVLAGDVQTLESELDAQSGTLATLADQAESLDETVVDHDSRIAFVETALTLDEARIGTVEVTLSGLQTEYAAVVDGLSDLGASVDGLTVDLGEAQGLISSQGASLVTHATELGQFGQDITSLQLGVTLLTSGHADHETQVATVQADIDGLQSDTESLDGRVGDLEAGLMDSGESLVGLEADLTTLEAAQASQGTAVSGLTAWRNTVSASVGSIPGALTRLTAAETAISSVQSSTAAIPGALTRLSEAEVSISSMQASVGSIPSALGRLSVTESAISTIRLGLTAAEESLADILAYGALLTAGTSHRRLSAWDPETATWDMSGAEALPADVGIGLVVEMTSVTCVEVPVEQEPADSERVCPEGAAEQRRYGGSTRSGCPAVCGGPAGDMLCNKSGVHPASSLGANDGAGSSLATCSAETYCVTWDCDVNVTRRGKEDQGVARDSEGRAAGTRRRLGGSCVWGQADLDSPNRSVCCYTPDARGSFYLRLGDRVELGLTGSCFGLPTVDLQRAGPATVQYLTDKGVEWTNFFHADGGSAEGSMPSLKEVVWAFVQSQGGDPTAWESLSTTTVAVVCLSGLLVILAIGGTLLVIAVPACYMGKKAAETCQTLGAAVRSWREACACGCVRSPFVRGAKAAILAPARLARYLFWDEGAYYKAGTGPADTDRTSEAAEERAPLMGAQAQPNRFQSLGGPRGLLPIRPALGTTAQEPPIPGGEAPLPPPVYRPPSRGAGGRSGPPAPPPPEGSDLESCCRANKRALSLGTTTLRFEWPRGVPKAGPTRPDWYFDRKTAGREGFRRPVVGVLTAAVLAAVPGVGAATPWDGICTVSQWVSTLGTGVNTTATYEGTLPVQAGAALCLTRDLGQGVTEMTRIVVNDAHVQYHSTAYGYTAGYVKVRCLGFPLCDASTFCPGDGGSTLDITENPDILVNGVEVPISDNGWGQVKTDSASGLNTFYLRGYAFATGACGSQCGPNKDLPYCFDAHLCGWEVCNTLSKSGTASDQESVFLFGSAGYPTRVVNLTAEVYRTDATNFGVDQSEPVMSSTFNWEDGLALSAASTVETSEFIALTVIPGPASTPENVLEGLGYAISSSGTTCIVAPVAPVGEVESCSAIGGNMQSPLDGGTAGLWTLATLKKDWVVPVMEETKGQPYEVFNTIEDCDPIGTFWSHEGGDSGSTRAGTLGGVTRAEMVSGRVLVCSETGPQLWGDETVGQTLGITLSLASNLPVTQAVGQVSEAEPNIVSAVVDGTLDGESGTWIRADISDAAGEGGLVRIGLRSVGGDEGVYYDSVGCFTLDDTSTVIGGTGTSTVYVGMEASCEYTDMYVGTWSVMDDGTNYSTELELTAAVGYASYAVKPNVTDEAAPDDNDDTAPPMPNVEIPSLAPEQELSDWQVGLIIAGVVLVLAGLVGLVWWARARCARRVFEAVAGRAGVGVGGAAAVAVAVAQGPQNPGYGYRYGRDVNA